MNPNFGGDLRSFIFEQTPEFDQLQSYISDQLGIYFPQVTVVDLEVNIDADAIRYGVGRHRRFARAGQRITQCSQRRTQGEE